MKGGITNNVIAGRRSKAEREQGRTRDAEDELKFVTESWQRVLRAYNALHDVKTLRENEPHTPALARYVDAKTALLPGDLKVLK